MICKHRRVIIAGRRAHRVITTDDDNSGQHQRRRQTADGNTSSRVITASPSIRSDDALMRGAMPVKRSARSWPLRVKQRMRKPSRRAMSRSRVLDLVNPERAGRWPRHLRRLARFDEAGWTAHDHGRRIEQRARRDKPIFSTFNIGTKRTCRPDRSMSVVEAKAENICSH